MRYLQQKTEHQKYMDYDLRPSYKVKLTTGNLNIWQTESAVLDYGMIIICRAGEATLHVNFGDFHLSENSIITLFPNDVVMLTGATSEFTAEYLRYDASILREASLQLEQTVYRQLRNDRCRSDSKILTEIINSMFTLLKIYFSQKDCLCLDQLVLLQLKAFFIGFHDYLQRFPDEQPAQAGSRRVHELFDRFMFLLENRYKDSRDVAYYASLLHITPKYLNTIVRRISGHSVKTIIDHYVILQLKLTFSSSTETIKEVAWRYHFSDLSFLCRYFKQHTGMTPQQFKRRIVVSDQ